MSMKRRQFITLLGGVAGAWPLAARAQQAALPVIGFLSNGSADAFGEQLAGFRKGLADIGYVEGRNVRIEYRGAEGRIERFPEMAADLVRLPSTVIFVNGPAGVRAAQLKTAVIPIVFSMGEDPVKEGLVTSLNRPTGNITGLTTWTNQLFGKRLQLLFDVAPAAVPLALLVNPINSNFESDSRDARAASAALGRELRVLTARSAFDFEVVGTTIGQETLGALMCGIDPVFLAKRALLASLAIRHAIPTM